MKMKRNSPHFSSPSCKTTNVLNQFI